jgi:hypothetical protein
VHDVSNTPVVSLRTASVPLTDVDPLHQIAILGDISVDGLTAGLVCNPGGTTNVTPLMAALAPSNGGLTKAKARPSTCSCARLLSPTANLVSLTMPLLRRWRWLLRAFTSA